MLNRRDEPVLIPIGKANLDGRLTVPDDPAVLVVIASVGKFVQHPDDRRLSAHLGEQRCAVLLVDLLTRDQEMLAARRGEVRLDTAILSERLDAVIGWLDEELSVYAAEIGRAGAGRRARKQVRTASASATMSNGLSRTA